MTRKAPSRFLARNVNLARQSAGWDMARFLVEQTVTAGVFFAVALVAFSQSAPALAQPDAPQREQVTLAASESPPIAPDAPFTAKVKQLVAELTVDEKISLVHGQRPIPTSQDLGQAGYTPGIPRLGIPGRKDADAVGVSVFAETTAPPTKIAIAASFDRSAAQALGELEGLEGRAVGIDLIYGPQLDISRVA